MRRNIVSKNGSLSVIAAVLTLFAIGACASPQDGGTDATATDDLRRRHDAGPASGADAGTAASDASTTTTTSTADAGVADASPPSFVDTCTGPELVASDTYALFDPATTTASFGAFDSIKQTQRCNDLTGCTAWSDWSVGDFTQGQTRLDIVNDQVVLTMFPWDFAGENDGHPAPIDCRHTIGSGAVTCSFHQVGLTSALAFQPGVLRNECLNLVREETDDDGTGNQYKKRTVIRARHRSIARVLTPALDGSSADMLMAFVACSQLGCGGTGGNYFLHAAVHWPTVSLDPIAAGNNWPFAGGIVITLDSQGNGQATAENNEEQIDVTVAGSSLQVTHTTLGAEAMSVDIAQ
jgi:hypothetical protein